MDDLGRYREIIERTLLAYSAVRYAYGQIENEAVLDRTRDRYLVVSMGWQEDGRRIHGVVIHLDLIDGKVWIQRDGTERGVAYDLIEAGIPKQHIVLGFRSPELRKHTDFAVA